MFDVSRILAIPDESVDYLQMGISGIERAELKDRGFVRKDGTKAKDYMIRTIQKTEKNKAKAEKAIIKGDKKLSEVSPSNRGLAVTDKKGFQSEGSAAKKIKSAISGQSKGGKVTKGESPDTRNAGYINFSGDKPQNGKIHLVDYRRKGVNAYVAKLSLKDGSFDGIDRQFVGDHGQTETNAYKGKENVKEWSTKKLKDGIYEANSRKAPRGEEKSYFSIKNGKIDKHFASKQEARETLLPKDKKLSKPDLESVSDAQRSYAESVRDKHLNKLASKNIPTQHIQAALNSKEGRSAKWWLDNKDNAGDKIEKAYLAKQIKQKQERDRQRNEVKQSRLKSIRSGVNTVSGVKVKRFTKRYKPEMSPADYSKTLERKGQLRLPF